MTSKACGIDAGTKCGYCLNDSGAYFGDKVQCKSIQLRVTRQEDWQTPIAACANCRAYLQEGTRGRWRYTPEQPEERHPLIPIPLSPFIPHDARGKEITSWGLLIDDRGTIWRYNGRMAGDFYVYLDEVRFGWQDRWWVELSVHPTLLNPLHLLVWDESWDQLAADHTALSTDKVARRRWYEKTLPSRRFPSRNSLPKPGPCIKCGAELGLLPNGTPVCIGCPVD